VTDVDGVVQSIRDGKLAVLPTDTVYGLVCAASHKEPAVDLYLLKGRAAIQPTAVVFGAVDVVADHLPELDSRVLGIVAELLPGPYTLVVPNPETGIINPRLGRRQLQLGGNILGHDNQPANLERVRIHVKGPVKSDHCLALIHAQPVTAA